MHSLLHLALAGGVLSQRLEPAFRIHRGDVDGYHAQPTLTKRQQSEPCGEIRKLSLAYKARQSKPGAVESDLLVPAQYAYDCVMSVPVDVEGDLKEIAELKDVLQYQATLSWLKDGAKYQRKPLDIMTELDQIANDVKNNQFTSDYEVQMAIRTMIDCKLQPSTTFPTHPNAVRSLTDTLFHSGRRLPSAIRPGYYPTSPIRTTRVDSRINLRGRHVSPEDIPDYRFASRRQCNGHCVSHCENQWSGR